MLLISFPKAQHEPDTDLEQLHSGLEKLTQSILCFIAIVSHFVKESVMAKDQLGTSTVRKMTVVALEQRLFSQSCFMFTFL